MKSIIYYTCNTHKPKIDELCRKQLIKSNLPIVSVSLNKNLTFGDIRITIKGQKGPLTMYKQIVAGLEASPSGYIFLVENDVLYHPSHFDFTPIRDDVFYFNTNVWKMRWEDGHCVWTDDNQQLSGMSGSRKLLLKFFRDRVAQIEKEGFNRHFEPQGGTKENYQSETPNIDIRHDANVSISKWSPDDYRNKRYAKGWKEADFVPGWDIKQLYG